MLRLRWTLFAVLATLLPFDGSSWLRAQVGEQAISITDLVLLGMLFLDLAERILIARPTRRFTSEALLTITLMASLSTVSLLYVGGLTIRPDLKLTANMFLLIAFVFVLDGLVHDRRDLVRASRWILFGASLLVVVTLAKVGGFDLPGEVRADSLQVGPVLLGQIGLNTIGQPTSTLLLLGFPIAWILGPKRTWLRHSLLLAFCLSALAPLSRGLLLGFTTELLLLLAWPALTLGKDVGRAARFFIVAILLGILVNFGPLIWDSLAGFRPGTVNKRFEGIRYAVQIFAQDPVLIVFGAGRGEFVTSLQRVPHNMFLDVLVSKGLVTLSVYIFFLFRLASKLFQALKSPAQVGQIAKCFLVVLLGMLVYGMAVSLSSALTYFLALGLIVQSIALNEITEDQRVWPAEVITAPRAR